MAKDDDLPDDVADALDLQGLIAQAKKGGEGGVLAAHVLLAHASNYLRIRQPIPEALADYLADCMDKICPPLEDSAPQNADDAFHLKLGHGRKKGSARTTATDWEIAKFVHAHEGSREDGLEAAADKFLVSVGTARRLYEKHRSYLKAVARINRES